MKFSSLPVMGGKTWFNDTLKSLHEAGSQVQNVDVNYDYVLTNGATRPNGGDDLYIWSTTLNDGVHQFHLIGGAGKVHHGALKGGQHFGIRLPIMKRGVSISGQVFNTTTYNVEMAAGADEIQFIALGDAPEVTDWIQFLIYSPF